MQECEDQGENEEAGDDEPEIEAVIVAASEQCLRDGIAAKYPLASPDWRERQFDALRNNPGQWEKLYAKFSNAATQMMGRDRADD